MVSPILLRGLGNGVNPPPTILKRTDQEFIPALLDELAAENGLAAVADTAMNQPDVDVVLKLFQPIHRTFHVVLLDLACDIYGQPRFDPERIESAGLVVRRVAVDDQRQSLVPEVLEGWIQDGRKLRGWVRCFPTHEYERLDPEPTLRPPELRSGNAEVDRQLALRPQGGIAPAGRESSSSLFTVPPAVCQATNRTILYGLIPVTSVEVCEQPPHQPPYEPSELRTHLPPFMRSGAQYSGPSPNVMLNYTHAEDSNLNTFILLLRQIKFEFDAFGDSQKSRDLFDLLNRVSVDKDQETEQRLGDFLKLASRALVDREGFQPGTSAVTIKMPNTWPKLDKATGDAIFNAVLGILNGRLKDMTAGQGRFDDLQRQYRLRAFVRIKLDEGCPPITVWSDYSQRFTIAPWYENSGLPPVQVSLPNVLDLNTLKQLKPNVAFNVPSQLFNFLQASSPADLLKGKGQMGTVQPAFDWICGFNIPIITLCAFIVLNIFLSLLNLVFQWLMFVKICIPFPKRQL